jgi:hypothetical protein
MSRKKPFFSLEDVATLGVQPASAAILDLDREISKTSSKG